VSLLADEDVDGPGVERLRQDGHTVLYVAEMEPGIADEAILQKANERQSLLVTADKDFGEMMFWQNLLSTGGVVLIRLAGLSPERKAEVVSRVFRDRGTELPQAFSAISPGRVRIRPRFRAAVRRV
jgi:predicted nuclease of predicted toxin-antitoxin system